MSRLFKFYNRAVEDSDLITVFDYDDKHYELMWAGGGYKGFVKTKEEVDAKVKSGEYEIVEDFRKPTKPSVKQFDIVPCPAFSATLAVSKDNFRSTKELKSVKELKEYVEALEKVFGSY